MNDYMADRDLAYLRTDDDPAVPPTDTCERCGEHAEDEIRVFDDTNGATVCDSCGQEWLLTVVRDGDASLRVFLGRATPEEVAEHAHRLLLQQAQEALLAEREEERLQRASERKATAQERREARAAAPREERALLIARFVQGRGELCNANSVARHLGVSRRTLSRSLDLAVERGWVVTRDGVGGGILPGGTAAPVREEVEAADQRVALVAGAA